jgi:hypothetical protein
MGLWPLACWDFGFESRRRHEYISQNSMLVILAVFWIISLCSLLCGYQNLERRYSHVMGRSQTSLETLNYEQMGEKRQAVCGRPVRNEGLGRIDLTSCVPTKGPERSSAFLAMISSLYPFHTPIQHAPVFTWLISSWRKISDSSETSITKPYACLQKNITKIHRKFCFQLWAKITISWMNVVRGW